jgi:Ni/Co efflux regulator RcnB
VNKLISTIVLATVVVVAPIAAQAGQIQHRINHQETRIYQGVRNGSISSQEYKHLERREDRIEAARLRAIRSGGKFTKAEKYRLNHRLNNASRRIYHDKHD